MTKSGGNVSFYLDGTPDPQRRRRRERHCSNAWHIMRNGSYAQYANGNADEVAVYDRAFLPPPRSVSTTRPGSALGAARVAVGCGRERCLRSLQERGRRHTRRSLVVACAGHS